MEYIKEINASWAMYKTAVLSNDYVKITALSHPMVVEKSGGENYFIDDLLMDQGMFKSQGLKIKDLKSKNPSTVIQAGDELHAMMAYDRVLETASHEIVEHQFMLAASQDEGKTWTFFDLSKQNEESIKIYLPHYDERLNVYLKK